MPPSLPQGSLAQEFEELGVLVGRLAGQAPSPAGAAAPGYARALVALDSTQDAQDALLWGLDLLPLFGSSLVVAAVVEPPMVSYGDAYGFLAQPRMDVQALEHASALATRLLDDAAQEARGAGGEVAVRLEEGRVVPQILKVQVEEGADVVLVGSPPHTGLERFLLTSVADGVKNQAPCDVLLAKGKPQPGDVLCGVDGSEESKRAALVAYRFARGWGAALHVVHVPPAARSPVDVETLRDGLGLPWTRLQHARFDLAWGDPRDVLVQKAEELRASLLVLGSRGLGGVRALFAGSVSNHVAHHAPCTVLLAKRPASEPPPRT